MRIQCTCGRFLSYQPHQIGKKARCTNCSTVLTLSDPDVPTLEAIDDDEPVRPAPRARRGRDEDEPRRRSREDDSDARISARRRPAAAEEAPLRRPRRDEDEDGRPRRRRREEPDDVEEIEEIEEAEEERRPRRKKRAVVRGGGGFLPSLGEKLATRPGLWVIGILIFLGGAGVVMGVREGTLTNRSSATPREVTLDQLIATGPGDNAHVIVKGAHLGDNFVYEAKVRRGQSAVGKPWSAVYVPLVSTPPGAGGIAGIGRPGGMFPGRIGGSGPIKVIMVSKKAKNEGDLRALDNSGRIQGMIVNSISSLESKTQELLKQTYPGTDFNSVLILEEGRTPSSRGFVLFLIIGGAMMAVVGGMLGLVALVYRPR